MRIVRLEQMTVTSLLLASFFYLCQSLCIFCTSLPQWCAFHSLSSELFFPQWGFYSCPGTFYSRPWLTSCLPLIGLCTAINTNSTTMWMASESMFSAQTELENLSFAKIDLMYSPHQKNQSTKMISSTIARNDNEFKSKLLYASTINHQLNYSRCNLTCQNRQGAK